MIGSPQCAFGKDGKVDLWCEVLETLPDAIKFEVINGAWRGMFKDGKITFLDNNEWTAPKDEAAYPHEAELVWHGAARFRRDDYNAAIAWIEAQLRPPEVIDALAEGYSEIDFMEVERLVA